MAVTVGALPGVFNIQGKRGDKWGPFECTPRTALDLSGRTWLAQIRGDQDRTADVIGDIIVDATDAATGVIRITVPAAVTTLLATTAGKGTYYWDVQATLTADPTDIKTWFGGKVNVLGDVSVPA